MKDLNKVIEMVRENYRKYIFLKDDVYYLLEPVKYVYAYNDGSSANIRIVILAYTLISRLINFYYSGHT